METSLPMNCFTNLLGLYFFFHLILGIFSFEVAVFNVLKTWWDITTYDELCTPFMT